ncbi:hypothetical protein CPB83DRAFT_888467 [Crepidotus variabilis]|uniref:Uncharacterized protein n=1 Tax=Crepidotus variabilis TaxID=179855 RepID=A0A9P6EVT2_9AGAR|nr:hypothetical protein CPB83DRAFT_888467 [Crepidotus variabilis]
MKFSTLFSVALVILPAVSAGLVPRQNNGQRNRGGQGKGANNAANNAGQTKGGNGQNANNGTATGGQTGANNGTAAAGGQTGANNGGAAAGGANNGGAAAGGQNNGDPQKSLTLDPKVICSGFAQNGQDPPVAGQVASATSTNNFINNCLTVSLPLTNGQQIQGGSCNPAPIGSIPSINKMPSAKFSFPKNFATIPADEAFTFTLNIANLATGQFTNAAKNYFAGPQALDGTGTILGHSHITCDKLTAIDQTTATDPREFAFFKGLNDPAKNGVLTAAVDKGLPAGPYRCCTINSSSNHLPVVGPVAQHASFDDCSYFTAVAGGAGAGNTGAAAGGNTGAAAGGNAGAGANTGAAAAGAGTGKGGNGGANTGANAAAPATASPAAGNAGTGANNGGAPATASPAGGKGGNAGAGANTGANAGAKPPAATTAAAGAKPPAATTAAAGAKPPAASPGTGAAGGAKPPAGANNVGTKPPFNFGQSRGGRPRRDRS